MRLTTHTKRLSLAGLLAGFGVFVVFLVVPAATHAAGTSLLTSPGAWATETIQSAIGEVAQLLVRVVGFLFLQLVRVLIWVAEYSNFVAPGPTAVRYGWIVTRDLANMFFIVILLVIAFSTIIQGESAKYHYQKNLPRLLIMAVMINFSKTIVGVLIDFSQVIMLTFVNGFAQAAGGNFLQAMQVSKLMALTANGDASTPGLLGAYILAVVMSVIALAVVLILVIHLVARIVELWVLIILAPIAFLSSVIQSSSINMYTDWWNRLTKQLIAGPKIAFFIWLALITAQLSGGNPAQGDGFITNAGGAAQQEASQVNSGLKDGIPTQAAQADSILSMIIMIALLLAGLKEAQGAVNTSEIGKAIYGRAKRVGGVVGKFAWRETGGRATGAAMRGTGRAAAWTGIPILAGLGRATVAKGEEIRDTRRSAIEKFSGKPEDMARLSKSAFRRAAMSATGKEADKFSKTLINDRNASNIARNDPDMLLAVKKNLLKAKDKDANMGKSVADLETKFWNSPLTTPGSSERKKALSKTDIKEFFEADMIAAAGADLHPSKVRELMESSNPVHQEGMEKVFKNLAQPAEVKKWLQAGDPKFDTLPAAEQARKIEEHGLEKMLETWGVEETKIPASMYAITEHGVGKTLANYALESSAGDAKARATLKVGSGAAHIADAANTKLTVTLADPNSSKEAIVKAFNDSVDMHPDGSSNVFAQSIMHKNAADGKALREAITSRYSPGDVAKSYSDMSQGAIETHREAAAMALAADTAQFGKDAKKAKNWGANPLYEGLMPTDAHKQAVAAFTPPPPPPPPPVVHAPADIDTMVSMALAKVGDIEHRRDIFSAGDARFKQLDNAAKSLKEAATQLTNMKDARQQLNDSLTRATTAGAPPAVTDAIKTDLAAVNKEIVVAMHKASEDPERGKKKGP